jgi:hypothetical protein
MGFPMVEFLCTRCNSSIPLLLLSCTCHNSIPNRPLLVVVLIFLTGNNRVFHSIYPWCLSLSFWDMLEMASIHPAFAN